jgi:hypothetical protein
MGRSMLYPALQGAKTYQRLAKDAEQRAGQELAQFFFAMSRREIRRAQQCHRSRRGLYRGGSGSAG